MKIVIDARMYGLEHAGIGRYISNLVREISNYSRDAGSRSAGQFPISNFQFIILVRKKKFAEIKKEVGQGFKLVITDYPHYSLQEQIFLPLKLLKIKPDLVHFPHFNVPIFWWGKQVVTIHDLIKHESKGPQTTTRWRPLYWFKYLNYRFLVWLVVKRAIKVIVPSHYWKKELVHRFKLKPEKIVVTYEGADSKFQISNDKFQMTNRILKQDKITKPFIIYTGSLYPHKNVERLVEAVKLINQFPIPNYQFPITLIIVCSRNVFYQRFKKKVKEMEAEKLVNLVGFVPDEELVSLYQEAEAFVFPSLLEGFGLPGLEAMAVGLPVISSHASCLPEIYGDAAEYFNPYDVDDMAEKIKRVIGDTRRRETLREKGFKQVEKYSWQKMVTQTIMVYREATSSAYQDAIEK